jgi:membrane protease subunit (stomatin/prohibitin family)
MPLVRRPLARAAIVGGGAYVAGKKRAEAQQREGDEQARIAALEQQPQAAAPAAPAAPGQQTDIVAKLKELKELQDSGALTPEQFEAAKQKLLQAQ